MKRFIQSTDRSKVVLFPEQLEDYVAEDNHVRVVDVFVEQLDLDKLGFKGGDKAIRISVKVAPRLDLFRLVRSVVAYAAGCRVA